VVAQAFGSSSERLDSHPAASDCLASFRDRRPPRTSRPAADAIRSDGLPQIQTAAVIASELIAHEGQHFRVVHHIMQE
jgi:hypothetical protein